MGFSPSLSRSLHPQADPSLVLRVSAPRLPRLASRLPTPQVPHARPHQPHRAADPHPAVVPASLAHLLRGRLHPLRSHLPRDLLPHVLHHVAPDVRGVRVPAGHLRVDADHDGGDRDRALLFPAGQRGLPMVVAIVREYRMYCALRLRVLSLLHVQSWNYEDCVG